MFSLFKRDKSASVTTWLGALADPVPQFPRYQSCQAPVCKCFWFSDPVAVLRAFRSCCRILGSKSSCSVHSSQNALRTLTFVWHHTELLIELDVKINEAGLRPNILYRFHLEPSPHSTTFFPYLCPRRAFLLETVSFLQTHQKQIIFTL